MGCNCGGGARRDRPGEKTLGYQVTLPDGTKVPPDGEPPFLTVVEARVEVRQARGGTIHRLIDRTAGRAAP